MQYTQEGQTLYIQLDGEIDNHRVVALRDKIDTTYERAHCNRIVFDFANVTFMDSSGIGMIIGRYKFTKERGGSVAIRGMTPEVRRIFQMSGLAKIIEEVQPNGN